MTHRHLTIAIFLLAAGCGTTDAVDAYCRACLDARPQPTAGERLATQLVGCSTTEVEQLEHFYRCAARQCYDDAPSVDLLACDAEVGGLSLTCRQAVRAGGPSVALSFQLADLAWNVTRAN